MPAAPKKDKPTTRRRLLLEVAWEVCNQVGGIYTVIRSKVPAAVQEWGEDYLCIGPLVHRNFSAEFEPSEE